MVLRSGTQRPKMGAAADGNAEATKRANADLQSSLLLAVKQESESENEEEEKPTRGAAGKVTMVKKEEEGESPAKPKTPRGNVQAIALLKKLLDESSAERLQEVLDLQKQQLESVDAAVAKAAAHEEAQVEQVRCSQKELDLAIAEVKEALEKETYSSQEVGAVRAKRREASAKTSSARSELLEAQQFLQLVERTAPVARQVKQVKEQRRASAAAAEEARRKHKDILAATKRKLEELKFSNSHANARSPFQLALASGNDQQQAENSDAQTPEQKVRRRSGTEAVTPGKEALSGSAPKDLPDKNVRLLD
eukprot:gb/GFBE01052002.1/.p1 GENE.gb/GFBE01052002.1/~~gb/GFBE01052002.1/.p1  ORF type:complete len:308 (+),score=93.38 gb/GFBE01052002.1/:1-924(+)